MLGILPALLLSIGIAIIAVGAALTEDEHEQFAAIGTVALTEERTVASITADIAGQTQVIQVDPPTLRELGGGWRADLEDQAAVQIMLVEQPGGTFQAVQYGTVDIRNGGGCGGTQHPLRLRES